ncbi:unnamed protein product [Fusarium venenatum]|uniref:Uncharacterized protein n=1 Tax=Fusarium venenatum TaxID=56646 RepID=A0A2L2T6B5_9HYPO|nr:uncharacterized protein FVRRES_02854 [Fusarium venenatum]CEI66342.1 unnamed protein product [Fusarium venenatum]
MTPKRFITWLLSCFITGAWRITYLSTHLAPISGVSIGPSSAEETSFSLSPDVDEFVSNTKNTDTSISLPYDYTISTAAGGDVLVTAPLPTSIDVAYNTQEINTPTLFRVLSYIL